MEETNWDRWGKAIIFLVMLIIIAGCVLLGWAFIELIQWITSK